MTGLFALTSAFQAFAAFIAVMLARAREEHRPIAWFLGVMVSANVVRAAIRVAILDPAREAMRGAGLDPRLVPFTGFARIAAHVEVALFLLWPAGLAALAVALFARRPVWPVMLLWALCSFLVAITYPAIRQDALRRFDLAAELVALAVVIASIAEWWRKRRRDEPPNLSHLCLWLITLVEGGSLFVGSWPVRLADGWYLNQIIYSTLYVVLSVIQGGALWLHSKSH